LHSCCSHRPCLARFHIAHLHHAFTPTCTAEAERHCRAPLGQSAALGCRRTKATHHGHIAKSGHSSAGRSPSHLCGVLLEHRRQAGEPEPTPPTREPRHSLQHHHRGLRASRPRRTSAAARHRPASARRQIGTTPITGNRAIRCAPLLAFSAFAGQELPGVKLKPHAHCSSSSPLAGACHQKPPEQNTIAACRPSWRHHKNHDVKLELRRCSSSVPRPSASLPEPSAVTMSSSILISGHLSLSTAGELS
jgi:hypothetical protein